MAEKEQPMLLNAAVIRFDEDDNLWNFLQKKYNLNFKSLPDNTEVIILVKKSCPNPTGLK
jgi:hypothetical protein